MPPRARALLWALANVSAAVRSVKLGVRPVASMTVRSEFVPRIVREWKALAPGVRRIVVPAGDGQAEVLAFVHPHLAHVVRAAFGLPHDAETVRHWRDGKMYGYSEAEIGRFCRAVAKRRRASP